MIGQVEVIFIDGSKLVENNMLLDGFGVHLADIFSMPRFIANTTVSAILDTSNYVVQGISLGKDAAGYNRHAHSSAFSSLISDSKIRVLNYSNTSSYDSSNVGNILPEQPFPTATRLETCSTNTSSYSNTYNYGHNPNINKDILVEPEQELIGCYAPNASKTVYILSSINSPNTPIYSATLTGNNFNKEGTIGLSGIIRRTTSSIEYGRTQIDASAYRGLMLSYDDGWDTTGDLNVKHVLAVSADDQFYLNCFGGVYNLGLWGLDIRETLKKNLFPPYNLLGFQGLVFRLLSKKSFTRDITRLEDKSGSPGFELLRAAATKANPGLKIIWNIYFK